MRNVLSFLLKIVLYRFPVPSFLILAIILVSAYATYNVIVKYPDNFGLLKGPSIIKKEEQALIAEISRTLNLPQDEEPTIATVSEPEKLTDQSFFKDSQTGDRVIIYQNSKKVILYRPSEKRVIEVGVVNINQQQGLEQAIVGEQEGSIPSPSPEVSASPSPTSEPQKSENN